MSNGTAFPGLSDLAGAIANAEGYGVSGAIPTVANNPGNIALGDLGRGTLGQNISVYPDSTSGWNALNNQLTMIGNGQSRIYNPNMTLQQMGQAWAGGGTGSQNWVNNVAKYLGVDPNSTIGSILYGTPAATQAPSGGGTAPPAGSTGSGIWEGIQSFLGDLGKFSGWVTPAGAAASAAQGPEAAINYAANQLLFSSRVMMLVVGVMLFGAGALGLIWQHGETIVSGATEPVHGARRVARRVRATGEAAAELGVI